MAPAWLEFSLHLKRKLILVLVLVLVLILIEEEGELGRQEKDLEQNARGTWLTTVKLCFGLSLFILHHFY